MPDNILLIVFGTLSLLAIAIGGLAISLAMKNARKNGSELRMLFWAFLALAGLSFGGMCLAYFVIPILLNHL
jgi:heme/copper-type cytochrome/quinol oxidase subunit 3